MSLLHKMLLVTLIISTGAHANNQTFSKENINTAMQKAGEFVYRSKDFVVEKTNDLATTAKNVTVADIRQAATKNMNTLVAACELSKESALESAHTLTEWIKENPHATVLVTSATITAVAAYLTYKACQQMINNMEKRINAERK